MEGQEGTQGSRKDDFVLVQRDREGAGQRSCPLLKEQEELYSSKQRQWPEFYLEV